MDSRAVKLIRQRPAMLMRELGFAKLNDEFHGEIIKWLLFDPEDGTVQAHRGSYKTTCDAAAMALFPMLFPKRRAMFFRKTDTDVAEVMRQVADIIRRPLYREVARSIYGVVPEVTIDTQTAVSTSFACGVQGSAQVLGIGCGSSITGKHADLIITDDIVNVKDRVSPAEREKTKLVYQELQNVKNRGGAIKNTGTPWHKADAFSIMPNIRRFDCYSTGLMTDEEIRRLKGSMSPSLFVANYELRHIADGDAMFSNPRFFSDESLIYDGICHVDAAYDGDNHTAFTVMRRRGDEYYAFGMLWAKHVEECMDDVAYWRERLKAGTVYCEKNADKGYLAREFKKMGVKAETYSESTNKHYKIATHLKGAWGRMSFLDADGAQTSADYLNEILDYAETAAFDDAPDSCACAVRKLNERMKVKAVRGGF